MTRSTRHYMDMAAIAPPEVIEALGSPRWVRQAQVYVAATSKTAAVELLKQHGILTTVRALLPASGNGYSEIVKVGLLAQPGTVLVAPLNSRQNDPLIRLDKEGEE